MWPCCLVIFHVALLLRVLVYPPFPPNFSPVAQSGPRHPPPPLWHTSYPSLAPGVLKKLSHVTLYKDVKRKLAEQNGTIVIASTHFEAFSWSSITSFLSFTAAILACIDASLPSTWSRWDGSSRAVRADSTDTAPRRLFSEVSTLRED